MSASFPTAKLTEIAELNPPLPASPNASDEVSFVPMSAIDGESVNAVDRETRRYSEVCKGYTAFADGDVLVAKITPCFENGKIALMHLTRRYGFGSTEFHVVRPCIEQVDARYLAYYLRQDRIRRQGERRMTGSAGQRRVPQNFLADLSVPMPPLTEQRRIADILDKADALRAKRRAALAQLDTLTQSIFLEMFGDPATNPKGFPIKSLAEFYVNSREGTKCGPFGSALKSSELVPSGIPVWNMDNIDPQGRMALPFRMWVTEAKYRELESYAVVDGDVLISRAGTVGKMCVARAGYTKSILSTNLIRVRFGPHLLPTYFVSLMTFCSGRIGRLKTGPDGALTHMSTGVLDTLRFPYPSIELQQRFVSILELIEQRKSKLNAQLNELGTLFSSLQHSAFQGELFPSPEGSHLRPNR